VALTLHVQRRNWAFAKAKLRNRRSSLNSERTGGPMRGLRMLADSEVQDVATLSGGEGQEPAAAPLSAPSLSGRFRFWRSPADQPPWARPVLLCIGGLAGLAYAWGFGHAYLVASSWHNFVFGAADPWGTVSVDKLPGALWVQALSLRLFGFHVWAIVLPQVLEGVLTVFVLYRVVRRVSGAAAGLIAALVMAGSPVVILLNRGNVSDSLLILLLVLAADATTRASQTGRVWSLVWAGVLVGLAFQTKMLQAWLVLPAFFLAYLVAAPVPSFFRRVGHLVLCSLAVLLVSLSWMTAVSLVPQGDRPYVDGSCNDSVFAQVFSYNGVDRFGIGHSPLNTGGCNQASTFLGTESTYDANHDLGLSGFGRAPDRLLDGPFGHDDAWLLLPAAVSAVWIFVLRRRRPRTDGQRAAIILWSSWLGLTFVFLNAAWFLNSYYVAALLPAVAALCAMGAVAAWQRRGERVVRAVLAVLVVASLAVTVALVPSYAGVRMWIVASVVIVSLLAAGTLVSSLRPSHASARATSMGSGLAFLAMLLGSFWASSLVVTEGLGPFDTPLAPAAANDYAQHLPDELTHAQQALGRAAARTPPGSAVDVVETSQAAGLDILATGREFLPVGGFSGRAPSPALGDFRRLVAKGQVHRATVTTSPLTRTPDLRWVAAHCRRTSSTTYVVEAKARQTVFTCSPGNASTR
jgi:4-amino-4-deoxy-L-arabinose transferase-like glycosyltransferase